MQPIHSSPRGLQPAHCLNVSISAEILDGCQRLHTGCEIGQQGLASEFLRYAKLTAKEGMLASVSVLVPVLINSLTGSAASCWDPYHY